MAVRERMLVYSPQDEYLFDIPESQIYGGSFIKERINGEHSLTLVTLFVLDKEQRVLWRDGTGKWREYVISGCDEAHRNGSKTIGTYKGVWSLQHDLQVSTVSRMPGVETPVTAGEALGAAISGTSRWAVGTVTISTTGGASMYDMQSWDALKVLLETWRGEIDARIVVGSRGIISRYVDYAQQIGSQTATRRFEYARDLSGIDRLVDEGPVACRIIPRGKGEETESGGYGRKIKIGDVNDGIDWLQNNASAALYKLPDGNGDYEYPTVYADNGDIEDKQELKSWGLSVLNSYTTPKVTYKADVVQLHAAGMDVRGVSLGDSVQCSDRKFGGDGLLIEGRVVEQTIDLKDRRRTTLTIGYIKESITVRLARTGTGIGERLNAVEQQSGKTTAMLLYEILDVINQQINATGGYTYLVPGIGAVTYNTQVTDPSEGDEASQVTEMRGGTLRFANSRAANGDWNYTNVITADGYLALAATIARLTTGFIGNVNGNYWNLDTGELKMAAANTTVGTKTLAQYIGDNLGLDQTKVFNLLTNNGALQGLYMSNGQLYVNATYINTGTLSANRINGGTLKVGGQSNGNGVIQVLNASNVEICRLDKDGANIVGEVTMRASCNILDRTYTGTDTYDRRAETSIGVMHFADSSLFSYLVGSYVSSSNYDLPGLRITGINESNNSTLGYMQVIPPIQGSYKRASIYSEDPILITSGDGSSGLTGVLVKPTGIEIASNPSSKGSITLNRTNETIDIVAPTVTVGQNTASQIVYVIGGTVSVGGTTTYVGKAVNGGTVEVKAPVTTLNRVDATMLNVSGTKSRVVSTEDYSDRLLYCYETPAPLFGDVGSGTIDEDGTCVVSIDDVFSEAARTDMAYQVLLQKCGRGDLWVAEKSPTHFVVEGTPGLAFDWEVKAHQTGFETERLDDLTIHNDAAFAGTEDTSLEDAYELSSSEELERAYDGELSYIDEIESLYREAA